MKPQPVAYLFDGKLYRQAGLTAEQIGRATPLFAGEPPADPFEEWFSREYPLWGDTRDTTLKQRLRACWRAAVIFTLAP